MLLAATTAPAMAQTSGGCPALPAGTGLHWEQQYGGDFLLCKGINEAGEASLNIMLTPRDPDLALNRQLRAEKGQFAGEELLWHRIDNGNAHRPDELRRISVVKIDKRRYAQIWINATSTEELGRLQQLTGQLDPSPVVLAGGTP